MYLIWSIEHDAWWRAAEMGYTRSLSDAGVYTPERSRQIVDKANRFSFNECRIPLACIKEPHAPTHTSQ